MRQKQRCNFLINFCCWRNRQLCQRFMFPFYHHIYFRNMDAVFLPAINMGHMFVNFQNNQVCRIQNGSGGTVYHGEIEKSLAVHGCHGNHSHIYGQIPSVIRRHITENHRNIVAKTFIAQFPFITGAMPAVIGKCSPFSILFYCLNGLHSKGTANLDVSQFIFAFCQCCIQQHWKTNTYTVIYPVAVLHQFHRFFRCFQFSFIFFCKIHSFTPILILKHFSRMMHEVKAKNRILT